MQITVEIPDEFSALAQARGLTPESYVRSLVDKVVGSTPAPRPPVEPRMSMAEFLRKMAAFPEDVPQLPDEAFTRESFYQDHD